MIDGIAALAPVRGFQPTEPVAPAPPVSIEPVAVAPVASAAATVPLELPADACTSTPCGMELVRVATREQAVDQQAVSAEVLRHTVAAYAVYRDFRMGRRNSDR